MRRWRASPRSARHSEARRRLAGLVYPGFVSVGQPVATGSGPRGRIVQDHSDRGTTPGMSRNVFRFGRLRLHAGKPTSVVLTETKVGPTRRTGTQCGFRQASGGRRERRRGGIVHAMEAVLVGAPGSGGRTVGRALADRHGAKFVDLTGAPSGRADALSGLRRAGEADAGPSLRRVIAVDRIVADPAVRARLYRGRHVVWLDAPTERLIERLRSARRQDLGFEGDVRKFIVDHLSRYMPYYLAGDRVDASGSIAATIEEIEPLLAEPAGTGTLVLRAQIHGGFMELGTGIFGPSLAHVLRGLSARPLRGRDVPPKSQASRAGSPSTFVWEPVCPPPSWNCPRVSARSS